MKMSSQIDLDELGKIFGFTPSPLLSLAPGFRQGEALFAADEIAHLATDENRGTRTPLTVVPRSRTTAEMDTFMIDVSTTSTNIAIANKMASGRFMGAFARAWSSLARSSIEPNLLDSPVAGD
jgi:hypothetical protein